MWLVVGLGNPGREYENHRHNVGFRVADELARRWKLSAWRSKFGGSLAQKGERLVFKPQQYMNESGPPLQAVASFYGLEPAQVVVVHDDIDLEFERLKVKVGGGHGGHNGLRSILECFDPGFVRVRIGVGKPQGGKHQVVGHVLGTFSKAEEKLAPLVIQRGADAVEMVLEKGPAWAMNQVNVDPRS